jgi:Cu+-exporting ATPase
MSAITTTYCHHCQNQIKDIKVLYSELEFCCYGCESVYRLLNDHNLCQYYDFDKNAGIKIDINSNTSKYDYLDQEEVITKLLRFTDGKIAHIVFQIPQIHCNSCLWLLERLYKINEHVLFTEVHFEKKEIFIKFDIRQLPLKDLVRLLASIGYDPYIQLTESSEEKTQSSRTEMLKLGISGFCFANIMMLSLPEYFSQGLIYEASIKKILPLLSLGLSLPVFFYTALDFFIPSYKNLKRGILIIDLPVSIAIIITFLRSLYDMYFGISNGYLDSMTGIVFFMLIGRWLQNRTHTTLQFDRDFKAYFPIAVERVADQHHAVVAIEDIREKDLVRIYNNEIIPVDAILSKGSALIDYSFVNGESLPVKVNYGEYIYAGGKQLDGALELIVMKRHNQSHLTSLWNHQAFQDNKSEAQASSIDNIGMKFTLMVMALSLVAGGYWYSQNKIDLMWNSITTVLIVACPCALLLAHSFTNGHFMRILSQYKFYLRDASVIQKLFTINHIVFDKTGTLTKSEANHVSYEGRALDLDQKEEISSLLSQSSHTLSKSIVQYLGRPKENLTSSIKENTGLGVEGWIDDKYYKLGSDKFCELKESIYTKVNVMIDNLYQGRFIFRNVYRNGIARLIERLKSGFAISVISGDNASELENLTKVMPIDSEIRFNQTPQDKLNYIQELKQTGKSVLMIGDGLNDAGAFHVSDVAIALTEKNNYFNPASDIIMSADNLSHLDSLLSFIQKNKTVTYVIFFYSILYNIVGLFFALRGELSPVIAAILMPISSITIVLSVQIMTEYYHRKLLKNKLWKYS